VLTLRERYGHPLDDGWAPPPGVLIVRTRAFIPGDTLRSAATALHRLGGPSRPAAIDDERSEDVASGMTAASGAATTATARPLRDAFWRGVSRAEFPDRWIGWKPFARVDRASDRETRGRGARSGLPRPVDRGSANGMGPRALRSPPRPTPPRG